MKFEINWVETPVFSMKYVKFGTGEKTMAIIPGLSLKSITESAGAVCNSFELFHKDYTVYVFDRREKIYEGYTVKDMADDTAQAMKILGLKDMYVFGASQGGMITQCLAVYYPELVKKAVIGSSSAKNNLISADIIKKWVDAAEKQDKVTLNRLMFSYIYSDEFLKLYEKALPMLEQQGTADELKKLSLMARACDNFDMTEELKKVKCPVFAIGSDKDKIFGGDASREIAKLTKGECYIYEGYSHAVYDEAPDYRGRIKVFFEK